MKRLRHQLWTATAAVSFVLMLAAIAFWVRGYFVGDSASLFLSNRYEVWSQTGQFGFYVSENKKAGAPLFWRTSYQIIDKHTWISGQNALILHDRRVLKGFGARLVNRRYPEVEVPAWFLVLAFALPPALWLWLRHVRRRRQQGNLCPACGYDLRASPGACPECGHDKSIIVTGTPT